METICCLAGIARTMIPTFATICVPLVPAAVVRVADLDVTAVGIMLPRLLVCDVDAADVDSLELLRQFRFVAPECAIAAFTKNLDRSWGASCHLAGVGGVLAKGSSRSELEDGIRMTLESGCYTDPRFGGVAR